jgi:hypothetical protein
MKSKSILVAIVICVMALANIVSADIFGTGENQFTIDFVTIDNVNYDPDPATGGLYGAVDYEYRIGKYEITNAQWDAFVLAAGAPTGNPSDAYDESAYWTGTDVPTNKVSWYEALQFCNYLTSGDKSLGAYLFSGNNTNPGDFLSIDRDWAVSTYGTAYVIPTEDEWYKAAYYTGSGYSTYANGTDVAPIAGVDTNYDWAISNPWDIGTGTMEQNGTFDMMGNVWEWNEVLISSIYRGARGGSFIDDAANLESHNRNFEESPNNETYNFGFRIASVPEPATLLLLSLGGLALRHRSPRQCSGQAGQTIRRKK